MYKRTRLSPVLCLPVALLLCQCAEGIGDTNAKNGNCTAESVPCAFVVPVVPAPAEVYCVGAAEYRWTEGERRDPFALYDNSDNRDMPVRLFDPPESNVTEDFGASLSSAPLFFQQTGTTCVLNFRKEILEHVHVAKNGFSSVFLIYDHSHSM